MAFLTFVLPGVTRVVLKADVDKEGLGNHWPMRYSYCEFKNLANFYLLITKISLTKPYFWERGINDTPLSRCACK